nr:hypothetical protein [uncultured Flavobacterium sp.]
MNALSKKVLSTALILCSGFLLAQPKIPIKYYVNNTEFPIENVKFFLVTQFDTITPKIEKGKIKLSKGFKENFSLFVQIDGRTMKIGSYRPATFNQIDGIAVGRITDFSTLKKSWKANNAFRIDKDYEIIIPDSENLLDVIYFDVKNDVNVSGISNYKVYVPTFDFGYEIIATKN